MLSQKARMKKYAILKYALPPPKTQQRPPTTNHTIIRPGP